MQEQLVHQLRLIRLDKVSSLIDLHNPGVRGQMVPSLEMGGCVENHVVLAPDDECRRLHPHNELLHHAPVQVTFQHPLCDEIRMKRRGNYEFLHLGTVSTGQPRQGDRGRLEARPFSVARAAQVPHRPAIYLKR